MTTYTKLTDFFPADMFAEILNAAEQGTKHAKELPDLPLIIDVETFTKTGKFDSRIHSYIDKYFDNLGYNTEKSVCRLQGTLPGTEYKIHKDTPSKVVTLLIYVKGEEGTTFYEDVHPKSHISWNDGCPKADWGINPTVDTFTPNAGYWFDRDSQPWHSYKNNQDSIRWVFMYNIQDTGVYDSVSRD